MAVEITKLKNGLTVATDPMPGMETTSIGLWVDIGTRNEPDSANGVAHLVEHMMFKGTKRRTAFDISAEIEAVGGQLNAYTTREQTGYHARVLAEDVPLAIDLLADMLQNSALDQEELDRERTVISQEIGQAFDTPDDIIFDLAQEQCYRGQTLGKSILGTVDVIANLPRRALADYIAANYSAGNIVLAAAGKVDHEKIVRLADAAFAELPGGIKAPENPADYTGGIRREDRDLEQMHIVLSFEGCDWRDPDYYAFNVLSTLLGGGMSSRLFQEVREKRGLVYSIYSYTGHYNDSGLFGIYAGTGVASLDALGPLIAEELGAVSSRVTDEETARAKAQLRAGLLMAQESSMNRAERLAQHIHLFGEVRSVASMLENLAAVDAKAVMRAALRLRRKPATLCLLGPDATGAVAERFISRFS